MDRDQRRILIAVVVVFVLISAGLMWRSVQFSTTHYRIGEVPADVANRPLPQTIPLSAMRPPAIRPIDPIRYGGTTATVSVIEYGDYQCPTCRTMAKAIADVIPTYGGIVRFIWRDFPIDTHPDAKDAAIFARCAGVLGDYWGAYDGLMASPTLGRLAYATIAQKLKVDQNTFQACRADQSVAAFVTSDVDNARADGINTSPLIFVGTTAYDHALTKEELTTAIEAAMKGI